MYRPINYHISVYETKACWKIVEKLVIRCAIKIWKMIDYMATITNTNGSNYNTRKWSTSQIFIPVKSIIKVFNILNDRYNKKFSIIFKVIKNLMTQLDTYKLVDMIIHNIISSKTPMTIKLADSIADRIICMRHRVILLYAL